MKRATIEHGGFAILFAIIHCDNETFFLNSTTPALYTHFNLSQSADISCYMFMYFVHILHNLKMSIKARIKILTDCSRPLADMKKDTIGSKRSHSTGFSEYQLIELRKRYKVDPYIKGKEKEAMAKSLGISMQKLFHWFKNKRQREKNKKRH